MRNLGSILIRQLNCSKL
ncbi:hypothetical protein Golob_001570 [Gossypium lobatum]|uniref:Uncharacterized protein n=1 Tax=Gossypium lobatum TaxID=34289 RepID=A0A7J8NBQ2_9ROSI|nr:hypothetical protein [Gossypium lobatum]